MSEILKNKVTIFPIKPNDLIFYTSLICCSVLTKGSPLPKIKKKSKERRKKKRREEKVNRDGISLKFNVHAYRF